ncbi:MAG: tetratricopeptide repeat protein [Rhodospirillaceae bacterium]|nr:tetratricopeptide repeat protein [Rhodospirillaceae bacterium]
MTPPAPTPDLASAIALHQAGRLTEAHEAYQMILRAEPANLDALHGLGLLAVDLGQPERALPLLTQCVAAAPTQTLYRVSLGLAHLRTGDFENAAGHFLESANRLPHALEPRLYLARALGALGRWDQAHEVLIETAKRFPGRADVWAAKGNAERVLLRHVAAENSLRKALALTPHDVDVLNNMGVVVRAQGRTEEAVGYYREALARGGDRAVIHANLGNALTLLGHTAMAETHLRRAVALAPDNAEARYNLGVFLTRAENPAEAVGHFRAALKILPDNVDAWTNLGVALLDTGDTQGAEDCYRRAVALRPDNAEAHYNLAWVLLLTGQWTEGWQEYEWRWSLPNFSSRKRSFDQPSWDGQPVSGTLLLHAEQGLGDAIQFVRYAAAARGRCARLVIECPKVLQRLFADLADDVVAAGDELPAFDAHAPFMSLPRIFATTPENAPRAKAYLNAPAPAPDHLRLPVSGRPRIGLVWAGSPDNKIDRRRTLPARLFGALAAGTDADFISLQVGARAQEAEDLPPEKLVFACEGRVADFSETAAVIGQLDLVVGVDTAVIHLAAAMGKPAWMLAPFMPDYRWLLWREDSPWYPSIRLFRQHKMEDWRQVIARVALALTNWQRPQA